jgi:hypothetical protein
MANAAGLMSDGSNVSHRGSSLVFSDELRTAHFGLRISHTLLFKAGGIAAVSTVTTNRSDDSLFVTLVRIDSPRANGLHEPLFNDLDRCIEML